MNQLALIEEPPRPLTPRQELVLDALRRAGAAGMTPLQAGAMVHFQQGRHGETVPCDWCVSAGLEILRALRKKDHARYSAKLKVWVAVDAQDQVADSAFGEIPY